LVGDVDEFASVISDALESATLLESLYSVDDILTGHAEFSGDVFEENDLANSDVIDEGRENVLVLGIFFLFIASLVDSEHILPLVVLFLFLVLNFLFPLGLLFLPEPLFFIAFVLLLLLLLFLLEPPLFPLFLLLTESLLLPLLLLPLLHLLDILLAQLDLLLCIALYKLSIFLLYFLFIHLVSPSVAKSVSHSVVASSLSNYWVVLVIVICFRLFYMLLCRIRISHKE
jgi:hypothetical protein